MEDTPIKKACKNKQSVLPSFGSMNPVLLGKNKMKLIKTVSGIFREHGLITTFNQKSVVNLLINEQFGFVSP